MVRKKAFVFCEAGLGTLRDRVRDGASLWIGKGVKEGVHSPMCMRIVLISTQSLCVHADMSSICRNMLNARSR